MRAALAQIVCIQLLAVVSHCDGQVSPQPDASALQAVRDGIATNAAAFPRGQLTATVHQRDHKICEARATVAWDGARTRWKYDLSERHTEGVDNTMEQRGVHMLDGPGEYWFYLPEHKFLQGIPDKSRTYYPVLRLRPDLIWYAYQTDPKRPFAKYLDPDVKPEAVTAITARRIDNDEIEIVRQFSNGLNMTFVASMRHGGNIVRYYREPDANAPPGIYGYGNLGELEWSPVGDGRFYLKSYKWREFRSDPDEPFVSYELNVESFDPNPQFPSDYFTLKGLDVAPGTQVEDLGPPERVYTYGKEPVLLKDEELNRLADQQRKRGFALPERQEAK